VSILRVIYSSFISIFDVPGNYGGNFQNNVRNHCTTTCCSPLVLWCLRKRRYYRGMLCWKLHPHGEI